jgi:hypothetical protein
VKRRGVISCRVRLFEIQLGRKHRLEPRLIRVADIRPLPDLDHIEIFEYLEAVAASQQQEYRTSRVLGAGDVIVLISPDE